MNSTPSAFWIITAANVWERFSFFSLRSIYVLYLIQVLRWHDDNAYLYFGAFMSLASLTPVLGGYLCDRVFNFKTVLFSGALCILLGHLCLTLIHHSHVPIGLSCIIVGTGLFVPASCSLIGRFYADPTLKERAFTTYYIGVNLGGILACAIVGAIAVSYSWHLAFGLAAAGMTIALAILAFGWNHIQPYENPVRQNFYYQSLPIILLCVLLISFLMNHISIVSKVVMLVFLSCILSFFYLYRSAKGKDKRALMLMLTGFTGAFCFFVMSEQAATSITSFAERVVDRHLFHWLVPTPALAILNPLYILLLSPLVNFFWLKSHKYQIEPNYLTKIGCGLLFAAVGFLVLSYAAQFQLPRLYWFASAIGLITLAELWIVPITLSAISDHLPARYSSTFMGAWFLVISIATYASAYIAQFSTTFSYTTTFEVLGGSGVLAATLFLLLTYMYKMTQRS